MIKSFINKIAIVLLLVFFGACKSSKTVVGGAVNSKLSSRVLIKNHYKNQLQFTTLRGKLKIDYKGPDDQKGFTVSFRMEKDKNIWISAPLGIVKALITPESVSFYNNWDNTYFEGDFSYLSKLLGTDLDFEKVQNILLGQAIFDLKKEAYKVSTTTESYQLKPKKEMALFKRFFQIEPANFKMDLQQLSQAEEGRVLSVKYKTYQKVGEKVLPEHIFINVDDKGEKTTIDLQYKGLVLDTKLRFPYKIPKGYKEIVLE